MFDMVESQGVKGRENGSQAIIGVSWGVIGWKEGVKLGHEANEIFSKNYGQMDQQTD